MPHIFKNGSNARLTDKKFQQCFNASLQLSSVCFQMHCWIQLYMFIDNKTKIPMRKTNESQVSLFQHSDFQHGDYDLHVSNYGVGFLRQTSFSLCRYLQVQVWDLTLQTSNLKIPHSGQTVFIELHANFFTSIETNLGNFKRSFFVSSNLQSKLCRYIS